MGVRNFVKTIVNNRPTFFVGRDSFLQELHALLQSKRLVAISAPAGMGKTAVALEYARRFSHAYESLFYLNMASTASWLADSLELAERLALPIPADEQHLVGINQALQNWLAQHPKTLLIVDNVGSIALPVATEQASGHMLFLTRKPINDASLSHIYLAALEAEEGALLLLRQSGQLAADAPLEQGNAEAGAVARTLADEMAGLPLALALAGVYVRTTRSNLREFLATYREYAARLVQLKVSKNKSIDALAITCSLPALFVKKTLPLATELLRFCAILAPVDILPEFFLQGASELTPALQAFTQKPALLDEALALLSALGLLVIDEESGALSMQMAVQETLCQAQAQELRNSLVTRALRAFSLLLPAREQATPATRMRVAAHVLHLAKLSSEWIIPHKEVADVFGWAASALWEQGLIPDAELLLRKALMIWERVLGTGHETVNLAMYNLGTLNALLENYAEAETLLQNALLARSRALGAAHPDVILCLLDLANIYTEQGKDDETRACYLEALKIGEPALGQEHPLLVVAAHKLALLAVKEEEFVEAEMLFQRVLPLYQGALGEQHPQTLVCLEQMAAVFAHLDRFEDAQEALQRVLRVKEQALGKNDVELVGILLALGQIYLSQERFAEAEVYLQRIIAIYEQMPDAQPLNAVLLFGNLATALESQGKQAQAEWLTQKARVWIEQRLRSAIAPKE
jgi:tetratricopeptide (TPR) repeat protein